jgi:hypothetical protein
MIVAARGEEKGLNSSSSREKDVEEREAKEEYLKKTQT